MTSAEIIKLVEEETGIKGVTEATTLDTLDSLAFIDLMVKCGVPRDKETGMETVGDIIKAVCA